MQTIYQQLENLSIRFGSLVKAYKVPDSHTGLFQEFMFNYKNYNNFYNHIAQIETEILPIFANNLFQNANYNTALTKEDIAKFLSGDIVIKTICDEQKAERLRQEIQTALESANESVMAKLLHLCVPTIIGLIYSQYDLVVDTVSKCFGKSEDISFEVGFFNISPGLNSVHWHDDYTLFCNKISGPNIDKRLLLNFHIALTDVTGNSSPVSFIRGAENIVYARSAIKYFTDNNVSFDKDLFLKATFLTENLYKPGEEVKANFIGLLPAIAYRMHQSKCCGRTFEIFYNELKAGQVQIFSPHLTHTSPFINKDNFARQSLVLRFFAGSDYNYRNVITVRQFINSLRFATAKQLSIEDVQKYFLKGITNISYDTKICFNIYINKGVSTIEHPKIYLEDLHNFFQNI